MAPKPGHPTDSTDSIPIIGTTPDGVALRIPISGTHPPLGWPSDHFAAQPRFRVGLPSMCVHRHRPSVAPWPVAVATAHPRWGGFPMSFPSRLTAKPVAPWPVAVAGAHPPLGRLPDALSGPSTLPSRAGLFVPERLFPSPLHHVTTLGAGVGFRPEGSARQRSVGPLPARTDCPLARWWVRPRTARLTSPLRRGALSPYLQLPLVAQWALSWASPHEVQVAEHAAQARQGMLDR